MDEVKISSSLHHTGEGRRAPPCTVSSHPAICSTDLVTKEVSMFFDGFGRVFHEPDVATDGLMQETEMARNKNEN